MADRLTELAASYTWQSFVAVVTGSVVSSPLKADATRTGLIFSNTGPGPVQVNFGPPSDLTTPLNIHPDKNPFVLLFKDVGPLIQQALNLVAPGTAGTITIIALQKV